MSTFSSRCSEFLSDVISYHRRFSSFQKIVIILITVGVLSTASYKFLTVGLTFVIALLGSIKLSQYVIQTRNTITFTETLWIYSRKYGFVFRYLGACRLSLLQWWHDYNEEQKSTNLAQTRISNKHQNEVFQDPVEDPTESEKTDLQNDSIFNVSNSVTPQHNQLKEIADKKFNLLDELELFISLISRDFIYDWYQLFSSDPGVLENVDDVLHHLIALMCKRLYKVNRYFLLRDVILYYREHLHKFQTARSIYKTQPRRASLRRKSSSSSSDIVSLITNLNVEKRISSIEEAFELKFKYHTALLNKENEINYLRGFVQILLNKLVQSEIRDSRTPQHALDEIFTCNIFYPLLELFSSSDFLHECIIMLLSDEDFDYINDVDDGEMFELPSSINETLKQDQEDFKLQESDEDVFHDTNEERENTSSKTDQDGNSVSISNDMSKNMSPLCIFNENVEQKSCNELTPEVKITDYEESTLKSCELVNIPQIQVKNTATDCMSEDFLGSGENMEKADPNSLQGIQTNKLFFVDSGDYDNVEIENEKELTENEELYIENNKTFITVSIPATEIAKEPRSSTQYTLYNIQYNAMYYDESDCGVVRTKTVKRRHREFINLQSRLEDNKFYSKILKDIKGPKRWKLPFGNMDKSSIENRRDELENYLKKLIEAPDICEGSELKEFLAYEEDAHISYFVKGASEISVPRIDQMIVRTVSGVFDKIGELSNRAQEALPSLPGRKPTTVKDKEIKSYPIEDTDQIKLEFCTIKEQVLMVEATIDDYIKQDKETDDKTEINLEDNQATRETITEDDSVTPSDGIELTKAIVDLAVQTLQSRDSWVCRERVIKFSQNLGGKVLNSWLKLEIDDLTTEERCAYYLHLLKETIWPDGKLSTERRAVKTDKQKAVTKSQAKKCLAEFFPDVIQFLVGEEDYNFSLDEIIESLQYEKLNRQFLFGLLDLLVERLFPETTTKELHQEFQR